MNEWAIVAIVLGSFTATGLGVWIGHMWGHHAGYDEGFEVATIKYRAIAAKAQAEAERDIELARKAMQAQLRGSSEEVNKWLERWA